MPASRKTINQADELRHDEAQGVIDQQRRECTNKDSHIKAMESEATSALEENEGITGHPQKHGTHERGSTTATRRGEVDQEHPQHLHHIEQ